MSENKLPVTRTSFKVFGTGLILSPALGIASAVTGIRELGNFALLALAVAGVALVIGLLALIWE